MITNVYGILTFLVCLTAAFSYINVRFIKLPTTIGIMLISLICSLLIIWLGKYIPSISSGISHRLLALLILKPYSCVPC